MFFLIILTWWDCIRIKIVLCKKQIIYLRYRIYKMALLTDDCDIRDTKFWMDHGGNGDFYISLMENEKQFKRLDFRFAMSGGNTKKSIRLRNAVVELYRAMEEMEYNKHPKDDI